MTQSPDGQQLETPNGPLFTPSQPAPADFAPPPTTSPAAQFSAALGTAIDAIQLYATRGENNRMGFQQTVTGPGANLERVIDEHVGGAVATAEEEEGEFAGLAGALTDFENSLSQITFPPDCREAASKVVESSEALRQLALVHDQADDPSRPANDKKAGKQFLKAVNHFEGSTAKLASKLGL